MNEILKKKKESFKPSDNEQGMQDCLPHNESVYHLFSVGENPWGLE